MKMTSLLFAIILASLSLVAFLFYRNYASNDKIAIDIVLIPPPSISELAIKMNHTLPETAAANFSLDEKTCTPHITLLMGIISRKELPALCHQFQIISQQTSPIDLEITKCNSFPIEGGEIVSTFVIKNDLPIKNLHEKILEDAGFLLHYSSVKKEMFYPNPTVNNFSLFCVTNFTTTSIRNNYQSHITLGIGTVTDQLPEMPIHFTASQLAICQLGKYCTCRKILWSSNLKK